MKYIVRIFNTNVNFVGKEIEYEMIQYPWKIDMVIPLHEHVQYIKKVITLFFFFCIKFLKCCLDITL